MPMPHAPCLVRLALPLLIRNAQKVRIKTKNLILRGDKGLLMGTECAYTYKKSHKIIFVVGLSALAIYLSIFFYASVASAAPLDITLSWYASSGADGYRLFCREDGQNYNYSSPDWEGTGTSGTIHGLDDLTTYHFVVRAFNSEGESGNSNEETYTPAPSDPAISLSTTTLSRTITEGSDTQSQTFTVRNSGGGTLNYSISDNRTWLSVSPSSGTSTGDQDTITVNYSTSGLTAGTYSGTITITDANATNSPQAISVSLTVNAQLQSNLPPNQPVISSPYDGEMETDLLLTLQTEPFSDPDGDAHKETQWQIIKKSDSSVVLEILTSEHLTSLPVPHAVLDRETAYLVSVQFYDSHSEPSAWSDPVEFTTITNTVDMDYDGVPDDSEVDNTVDLNEDGTPDNDQPDVIKSAIAAVAGKNPLGVCKIMTDVDGIVVLEPIHPSEILDKKNKPHKFLYGLVAYRLHVPQQGGTVRVKV